MLENTWEYCGNMLRGNAVVIQGGITKINKNIGQPLPKITIHSNKNTFVSTSWIHGNTWEYHGIVCKSLRIH